MAVTHNHEVKGWIDEFIAEGYSAKEAVSMAKKQLKVRKLTQLSNAIKHASVTVRPRIGSN